MTVAFLATLGLAAAAIAHAFQSARIVGRERREHTREAAAWTDERRTMVDQLCHLADKPWTPPPARTIEPRPEREPDPDRDLAVW